MNRRAAHTSVDGIDTPSRFPARRDGDKPGTAPAKGGRRHDDLVDPHLRGALSRHLLSLLNLERAVLSLTGVCVLLLMWDVRHNPFPWPQTAFVLGAVAALSLAVHLRVRKGETPTEADFVVHLLADIALLTFAFHETGGAENPFLVFYMLPLTLAAYALSWHRLLGVAITTCLMVALLTQRAPPALQFNYAVHQASELVSVLLITYFAYVVSRLSRGHDRRVAQAREDALSAMSNQALGSVAARAADTISSPLSTMSVLVNELRQERLSGPEREAALQTLTLQIAQCKTRLSELLDSVGNARGQAGEARDIRALVRSAVHECELIDPDLQVDVDQPTTPAPQIVEERSLLDALVMLIRHCGRRAPHRVHIDIRWSAQWVTLELQGRGQAPDPAGHHEDSEGDIALAASMIERFRGSLSCRVVDRQCVIRVHLPAMPAPLQAQPATVPIEP